MEDKKVVSLGVMEEGYMNKLKGECFGLLKEYEKDGEWEAFLDSILIKLYGFPEESRTINFYIIWHKLSSCRFLNYKYFRKTIFDVMNLLSKGV